MKVWALFHGGHSYAVPFQDAAEAFNSVQEARDTFECRVKGRDSQYPATDETAEMQVFKYDPSNVSDAYPDMRFYVGPRGGICKEYC